MSDLCNPGENVLEPVAVTLPILNGRRRFLQKTTTLGLGAFGLNSLFQQLHAQHFSEANRVLEESPFDNTIAEEDYWAMIQKAYSVNPEIINLNNGGVSPSPRIVQEAVEQYNKMSNGAPSYYMWRILDKGREPLRQKLADLGGCLADEIAINRNATEALNTVIYGLPLNRGDEVIGTLQDYPNMIQAWRQRAAREGIVYNQVSFDFPIEDEEQIVEKFKNAITPKTKILHVTHMINWVGQIMPVKKLCRLAHSNGIEVVVDGAHSFGLLDFKIPDLECDYFGTSLHKFLSAPIGSGMLWIKKNHIEKIWPLLCNSLPKSGDIRKFETLGTRSFPIEQGIGEAINFHNAIGSKRKEERIRYLKNYWAEKASKIDKVRIHTSLKPEYSCAICGVSIDGLKPGELAAKLFDPYKIHVTAIDWENIHCARVTPHVYTTLKEMDTLLLALTTIAGAK
ncbi:MAG: aminotransferase class V-fold PLP-dependent enzyme [Chitinophagaceae bacterium]